MKRITKLSELYKQIGNYLKQYGDADISSIATHSANEEHIRYSLNLTDIDKEDFTHIGAISVCYEDKYFAEPKDCLSCKNSFSEERPDGDVLHCMIANGRVVDDNDHCENWNR